jgi:hypothetical protein
MTDVASIGRIPRDAASAFHRRTLLVDEDAAR